MLTRLTASSILFAGLLAPAAIAGEAEGIEALVQDLGSQPGVMASGLVDLDDSGVKEGFVAWSDGCETSVGCKWVVVGSENGEAEILFTRFSSAPHIGVDALDRPSVIADGVPWRLASSGLYPGQADYPDELWAKASRQEIQLLTTTSTYTEAAQMSVRTTNIDLNNDGSDEIIMSIEGTYYAMMGGEYTPYVIYAASGDLLHSGYSADGPRIYPHDGGGSVVEVTPAGINVKLLE